MCNVQSNSLILDLGLWTLDSLERELPEHAILLLIEEMTALHYAPETHMLPAPHRELVEKRNSVAAPDGTKQRAIAGAERLIAAPAFSDIVDGVPGFGFAVRVTRIDASEVCE